MEEKYDSMSSEIMNFPYDNARALYANNISEDVEADLGETLSLEYKLREEKNLS